MKKALRTALKMIVFFLGWAILSGVIEIPADDPAVWRFFAEAIPLAVLIAFSAVFLRLEKGEVTIPFRRNAGKGALVGLLAGAVWIGLSAGMLLLSRQLALSGGSGVPRLWLWMLSAFLNVIMQELLIRGYLYSLLKTRYGLPAAVTVTTALFTLLHGGALEAGFLPTLNVVTMCLFMAALFEEEGTLLAPIMAHAVWNLVGALILGGVSLADDYPSLYSMTPLGNPLLSGGAYRIEASVVVTVINVALLLVFMLRLRSSASKKAV